MKKKVLLSGFVLMLLFPVFNGCVENGIRSSRTFYVDDDGGSDFTKIQNAIDAAFEGDTIFVHDGTYYEVLIIDKSIRLIGTDRDTTIINNQNSSQKVVVQINAESCIFKGFKVIGPDVSTGIIGISVNASNNVLTNNIVMNTEKGIRLEKNADNNSVSDTIATNNREGISVYRSNKNNISNNNISINISSGISLSYGIYFHGSNDNIISNNNISNYYRGMRIKGSDNSLVFDNSLFKNERGVWCCCGAENNMIYHNNFIQNQEFHAIDNIVNHWDNGTVGNYWDDYQEKHPDAVAENDIWSHSYNIYRLDDDKLIEPKLDRYPLVNPIE